MVTDGIAILKVGPALTYGLREAQFSLSMKEKELVPEEQRAAQAAQHPSASAHGADTADHAGGDHLEFKTVGVVDIGDGEARDPQIAAEAGQRAGETAADELHFSGVTAGVECRRRVAARGV